MLISNVVIFRIQGIFKILSSIYHKIFYWNLALCNPDIFRTLAYSQLRYTLKSKHIQSFAEYLKWRTSLKALCNYSKLRCLIHSKLYVYSEPKCLRHSLRYQLFFRTTNLLLLLYPVLFAKLWSTPYLFIFSATS